MRVGEANIEIAAEAAEWGSDLVILGTHGRTGSRRWILGSVAEAVIREVPVSVLVIPARVEAKLRAPVLRARRVTGTGAMAREWLRTPPREPRPGHQILG